MDKSIVIYKGRVFDQSNKLNQEIPIKIEGMQIGTINAINTAIDSSSKRMYMKNKTSDWLSQVIALSKNDAIKGFVIDIINFDGYKAEIEMYLYRGSFDFISLELDKNIWIEAPCEVEITADEMNEILDLI